MSRRRVFYRSILSRSLEAGVSLVQYHESLLEPEFWNIAFSAGSENIPFWLWHVPVQETKALID